MLDHKGKILVYLSFSFYTLKNFKQEETYRMFVTLAQYCNHSIINSTSYVFNFMNFKFLHYQPENYQRRFLSLNKNDLFTIYLLDFSKTSIKF